jgi:hypothetical protein
LLCLFSSQNFGEVNGADACLQAMERTLDVHEAGVVAGGTDFSSSAENGGGFFFEHGGGDIGVLDGEGAAKSAAAVEVFDFNKLDAADGAEELHGAFSETETAQAVAACVIGDAVGVVSANIFQTEVFGKEFGELEDARKEFFDFGDEGWLPDLFGHDGVVVTHHGNAG